MIRINCTDRQTVVIPLLKRDLYSSLTNEIQFSDRVRIEICQFYDLSNCTDRKLIASNRVSLCISDMTVSNVQTLVLVLLQFEIG